MRSAQAALCSHGAAMALGLWLLASPAQAEEPAADMPTASTTLARDYCASFVKEAEAARQSRQNQELEALNATLDKKLAEINAKTALLESWVTRREAILAEATTSVLKIYDAMDPVVASQEISKLDALTASAILRKMKPKKSSDILKEMDARAAARIIAIISAEANLEAGPKP